MKILFMCNTPYQIIVATQLRLTKFENDIVDLIISDEIAHNQELLVNIKKSDIFNDVYLIKSKKYDFQNIKLKISKRANSKLVSKMLTEASMKLKENCQYDYYFFANLGGHSNYIGRYLKIKNENIKICMFEDGFASYTEMYRDIILREKENSIKMKLKRIINPSSLYFCEEYYIFHPKFLYWNPKCKVKKIDQIENNENTITKLNCIFGYNESIDVYDKPIIFFEESYFADGIEIEDLSLITEISNIVDKKNIFVKIHPRNNINRFEKSGFKTNKNTFVPWEIIALNIDLSNKILITIASGSFITSYLMTGIAPKKAYMLMNLPEFRNVKLTPSLNILKDVCGTNKSLFKFINNKEEFINIIKQEINNLSIK